MCLIRYLELYSSGTTSEAGRQCHFPYHLCSLINRQQVLVPRSLSSGKANKNGRRNHTIDNTVTGLNWSPLMFGLNFQCFLTFELYLNKRYRKSKGQSRTANPDKRATLGIQDTGRRQTK